MVSLARQGNRQQSRRLVYTVSFSGETITNIYGFVLTDMRSISDSNPFSCLHSEQQKQKSNFYKSKPYLYVICNSHTQCKSVFAHKYALTWMGNMNDRFWPVWNLAWTQWVLKRTLALRWTGIKACTCVGICGRRMFCSVSMPEPMVVVVVSVLVTKIRL